MLKWLGALLILGSCVAGGRVLARRLQQRVQLLLGLQQGLLVLEREIAYAATPMAEALHQAAGAAGSAAGLFRQAAARLAAGSGCSAGEAWLQALDGQAERLTAEDRQILQFFAAGLGLSDRQDQLKRLEISRLRLQEAELRARDRYQQQGKIYRSLGWAGGLLLVLLFL